MTAALSCYGLEGRRTVGVVNDGKGISVLNPQMEFCSLCLWNNLLGFLPLKKTCHSLPSVPEQPNPFVFVLNIVIMALCC